MTDVTALQAELEKLRSVRRSGTLRARFHDEEVFYRSEAELTREIAALQAEIEQAQGTPRPKNVVLRSLPNRGW